MKKAVIHFTFYAICIFPNIVISQKQGIDVEDLSLDALLNIDISTAAKYEQKITEAPASVTIIASEQITKYGYGTLDQVSCCNRAYATRSISGNAGCDESRPESCHSKDLCL